MIKLEKGDIVTIRSNDGLTISISYEPIYDGKRVTYSEEHPNIRITRRGKILVDNIKDVNEN